MFIPIVYHFIYHSNHTHGKVRTHNKNDYKMTDSWYEFPEIRYL
jgi:hypothetical protein